MLIFFEILFAIIIGLVIIIYLNQLRRYYAIKGIKGPPLVPVVGHLLEFSTKPEGIYQDISRLVNEYGHEKIAQIWLGPFLQFVIVIDPKIVEKILNSSKQIDKPKFYEYLVPWLGYGLATNSGEKWRKRRKLLTPAFHFTILEECLETFNNASKILIEKLKRHIDGDVFDLYPHFELYGLDVIYETAMGMKIHAQTQSDSEYVRAVRNICELTFQRAFSVLDQSNFYFNNFSTLGKSYRETLKVLHDTSDAVIREKRKQLLKEMSEDKLPDESRPKKPMAFLDALLKSTIDGRPLTDSEVREEVDTTMFAGHDSVTSGLSSALYLLSQHKDVQNKVFDEIVDVLGVDKTKTPTMSELNSMKYLEAVIKESLRLYSSVPLIGRHLVEDVHLDNVMLPKNSTVIVFIHWLHRQSDLYPEPELFKPERFLNEGTENGRQLCSFIPFGAGPRNCIGQKFAMYEMKLTLVNVLRHYEFLPAGPGSELKLAIGVTCKSLNGIPVRITLRKNR